MPHRSVRRRLIVSTALAAMLSLALAACQTTGDHLTTGSLGTPPTPHAPMTNAEWRQQMAIWGPRYLATPGDAEAAINYARALRAIGERAQAVAVLQQASMHHPEDRRLLGAYGRALADAGEYRQALAVLSRAHTPDNPTWRGLNAQGAVLDQLGRHADAQRHYAAALKLMPNEPDVLSNLGLSYLLEKHLKQAEKTLRLAAAQPGANSKVRQNLALVVGLEGRFAEAEHIASTDLPPRQAVANVNYLRQMLAQRNTWKNKRHRPYISPTRGGG